MADCSDCLEIVNKRIESMVEFINETNDSSHTTKLKYPGESSVDVITLQNETLRLQFDCNSGTLIGLFAVESGWNILDRPHLGLSFRMILPMQDRRNNQILGECQRLASWEMSGDGSEVTFRWDELESQYGGVHPILMEVRITLTQRQAIYSITIENNSDFMIENVYCPYIGDISHGGRDEWLESFTHAYGSALKNPIWPVYRNTRGYHGVDHPTQLSDYVHNSGAPMSPFILLRGEDKGLYVGSLSRHYDLVAWQTELFPGFESSIDARMPFGQEIMGKDVFVQFAAIHVPYIMPKEKRALAPIAIEAYCGGWEKGVDIYKTWKKSWMKTPKVPEWARDPHSWQQIQINSPEDELRFRYRDLVDIGRECAHYGVKAIQLTGWNAGGQDRGNPSHDVDSRLGGFDELKEAIAKVQAMGVKVVLFAKFTWADMSTEWFRNELFRDAIKDPYGDYYVYGGYQYHTATQLLDINTRRLVPMCFLSKRYFDLCLDEFKKMVRLGCDGILFDKCSWHGQALFCFDTSHGHRYGAMTYEKDNSLIEEFEKVLGPGAKDFVFAGEACYDMMMQKYHVTYHRSERTGHEPLMRYMSPDALIMTAVPGFNDRNMLNQCLMYKYIPSYEPYNFKGRLSDYPLTIEYGKKMESLRIEFRGYFWDGEFRGSCGVNLVDLNGKKHHPYAVFANTKNGRLGVVAANYDYEESAQLRIEADQKFSKYRSVEDVEWHGIKNGIHIPPESAVVII